MIADLKRRVMGMVARAIITELKDDKTQTTKIEGLPGETLDGVERVQNYGLNSYPDDGAQALFLCVGGSRAYPIIISADHPLLRKKVEKGEVALYSKFENFVHLKNDGSIEISGEKISVKNGSDDLVDLIVQTLEALIALKTNTAIGPQPHDKIADLIQIKTKVQAFKV